jgi:flagellar biosynthesis protein FlhB
MADKQFEPSRRKLEKAREKGQLPRSPLLSSLAALYGGLGALFYLGRVWLEQIIDSVRRLLSSDISALPLLIHAGSSIVLFSLLSATFAGIISEFLQVGVHFNAATVIPKGERLHIGAGLSRSFSGLKKVFWLYLQVLGVLGGGIYLLLIRFPSQAIVSEINPSFAAILVRAWFFPLLYGLFLGGGVCAATSFLLAKRRFLKEMKMSFQEIKDEFRESEGNMEQKTAQRAEYAALLRGNMRELVKRSRVIIID